MSLSKNRVVWVAVLGMIALTQQSCFTSKKQIYFQGLADSTANVSMQQPDPIIQRGDQLMIRIYALDPQSAEYFNQPMGLGMNGGQVLGQMMQTGQGGGLIGYLVNEQGEIEFPKLGTINVLGYTQQRLRDSLQTWLVEYLKEPIATVRIMNFRVTYVTSDRANTVVIANNKTNILQFLGMVNGVTWMDKRDNIKVIRLINNTRKVYTINLTDGSVFESPAFYLQPNDIVYVEPNKRKFVETNMQLISYVATISSTLTVLYLFINNLTN